MEVANEISSLKTNFGIEEKCIKKPLLQVDVKIERESDNEEEREIDLLYSDHVFKEEMVIGPEVVQKTICNSNCSKDVPLRKKPKLDEETNQEDSQKETTKEEITVSDADILLHKKPRLQTQEATTDRQENTHNDTEVEITSNVDSKIEASTYIQTKQTDEKKRLTKKSIPSNGSKIQVKNKNVNRVMSYNVFTCNDCGEHFKRKCDIIQHIESHEKMKHKIYLKCEECAYQTVTRDSLERHKVEHGTSQRYVMLHHMNVWITDKKFSCNVCEYTCNRKDYFTNHMRIHTDGKRFSCTVCEYKCTTKSSLTTHMRIHTGDKPFSCTVCKYRCSHKNSLIIHMKMHTGEKPFSCTVCKYKCSQKSRLTIHMRIHTGEKPFACTVCEYRCAENSSLKKHMMTHTGKRRK